MHMVVRTDELIPGLGQRQVRHQALFLLMGGRAGLGVAIGIDDN